MRELVELSEELGLYDGEFGGMGDRSENRVSTSPQDILLDEFSCLVNKVRLMEFRDVLLDEALYAVHLLAQDGVPVTPLLAFAKAKATTTTPEFWLTLQRNHDGV